jgi:DNA sulfur modification protein DndB
MNKLYLPCLRGTIGDWSYYICIMRIKDVAKRIDYAKEIHKSNRLSTLIQRELNEGRGKAIKEYLINNKERFFNSMVVAVYEGDPEWYGVSNFSTKLKEIDITMISDSVLETIGVLSFSGTEKFFALDGQHRLSGIKQTIAEKPELGEEEISVIFVAHKNTKPGLQRSRRLFTVLNKTAKAVAKSEIIALDEDDTMAIITRRLLEENNYFKKDRIAYLKGNNIPHTNVTSITTIVNLYDILDLLFRNILYTKLFNTKANRTILTLNRLEDSKINKLYDETCIFFNKIFNAIKPLKEYSGTNYSQVIKKYRTRDGGKILFRPIGWSIIIKAIVRLNDKYEDLDKSLKLIYKLPLDLNEIPYKGVVWNSSKKTVITKGITLAVNLLLYMLNEYQDTTKLRDDYRKALGDGYESVALPKKIVRK